MDYIRVSRPKSGILENVLGFTTRGPHQDLSPHDLCLQMLDAEGYAAVSLHCCLSSWIQAVRQRNGQCSTVSSEQQKQPIDS